MAFYAKNTGPSLKVELEQGKSLAGLMGVGDGLL
jgi:hypothetical protein